MLPLPGVFAALGPCVNIEFILKMQLPLHDCDESNGVVKRPVGKELNGGSGPNLEEPSHQNFIASLVPPV